MRRPGTVAVVICLALAGCGDEQRAPAEVRATSPSVSPTPTLQVSPHRALIALSPRYGSVNLFSCSQPGLAYTDAACGSDLDTVAQLAPAVIEFVTSNYDVKKYPEMTELAGSLDRTINDLRRMGCFGMGQVTQSEQVMVEMCPTYGRLASLFWLSMQTAIDKL